VESRSGLNLERPPCQGASLGRFWTRQGEVMAILGLDLPPAEGFLAAIEAV
jgi:hypothetical protein